MSFTDKQRLFISEYLEDLNATQAAIRAGYSEKTARFIGHENLTKPNIRAEIDRLITERCMSKEEVLYRLKQQASSDISDYWDIPANGEPSLNLAGERAKGKLHLIKKLKVKKTTRTIRREDGEEDITTTEAEMELYDAQAADKLIGQYHKLFTERQEIDLNVDFTSLSEAELQQIIEA